MRWIPVFIGTLIASFEIVSMWLYADSAVQEAAQAGKAVAYVVIPYCFCRAIDSTMDRRDYQKEIKRKQNRDNDGS